jgi:hypothetical protein
MNASSTPRSSRHVLLGALVVLLSTAGCLAALDGPRPAAGEEDANWVDMPPTHLQEYEHDRYRGRDVYYIGGRWHYQTQGRWAAYTHEPRQLEAHRVAIAAAAAMREQRTREVSWH